MEIENKLYNEIKDYCKLNDLKIGDFINGLLRKAFNIEKYGEKPPFFAPTTPVSEEHVAKIVDKVKTDMEEIVKKEELVEKVSELSEDIVHTLNDYIEKNNIEIVGAENPKVFDKPAEITENAIWDDSEKFEENKPIKRKLK
jgi:hypothetical protein